MGDLLAQRRKKPTRMTFTWMCMRCLLNSLQALLKITTTIFPTTLIPLTNSIFVNYIFVSLLEQNFFTERYWIGATISIWKSHESFMKVTFRALPAGLEPGAVPPALLWQQGRPAGPPPSSSQSGRWVTARLRTPWPGNWSRPWLWWKHGSLKGNKQPKDISHR